MNADGYTFCGGIVRLVGLALWFLLVSAPLFVTKWMLLCVLQLTFVLGLSVLFAGAWGLSWYFSHNWLRLHSSNEAPPSEALRALQSLIWTWEQSPSAGWITLLEVMGIRKAMNG